MAKVLIYGAVAIGSLMACLLSCGRGGQPEDEIALLGRRSHIEAIQKSGLAFRSSEGQEIFRFRNCFFSSNQLRGSGFAPDLVLITVKTTGLAQVGEEIRSSGLLEGELKDSQFVLLMNGMGNVERLGLFGRKVFQGITSTGVVLSGPGQIELRGRGKTVIEVGLDEGISQFMLRRFHENEFDLEFALDFRRHQWNKLFANAVINPITALCGRRNGVVLSPHLKPTVRVVVKECVSVAEAEGIAFDPEEVLKSICSVASSTRDNTSSMLQDIRSGRRTEIDSINGYVICLAMKHGLEAPLNQTLCSLVWSLQERDQPGTEV